jgi:tRNA(fMet)-specific endonuclease VapC
MLRRGGRPLADADLQIAATALHHGLELVTGNVRHFERVRGLSLNRILADSRQT